jgi:hypothetical protein
MHLGLPRTYRVMGTARDCSAQNHRRLELKAGAWIEPNGTWHIIDDHADWIRRPDCARRIGLPEDVVQALAAMPRREPSGPERRAILVAAMRHGLTRFRGHGTEVTFETMLPLSTAIPAASAFMSEHFGPLTMVHFRQIPDGPSIAHHYQELARALEQGDLSSLLPLPNPLQSVGQDLAGTSPAWGGEHRIFLLVHHRLNRTGEYGLVECQFLVESEGMFGPALTLRYPRDEVINGHFLQDLVIASYYDRRLPVKKLWLCAALVYRRRLPVDLRTAEAKARTLAMAEEGIERLREAEGYVDDVSAYIFRVARVFRAESVVASDDDLGLGSTNFRPMTPDTLDAQIRAWQDL